MPLLLKTIDEIAKAISQDDEGQEKLMERLGYWPYFPLLEHNYFEVKELYDEVLISVGLNPDAAPLRCIVKHGLENDSYWGKHAVEWLNQGFPLDKELARTVDKSVKRKFWDQATRHKAFKLVRRWEKQYHAF